MKKFEAGDIALSNGQMKVIKKVINVKISS